MSQVTVTPPVSTEYLSLLQEVDRYEGDISKGEIEIVTDQATIAGIVEALRNRLSEYDLPPNLARIGVVFEDDYLIVIRDPVRFPNGTTGTYLRIFERAGLDGEVGVVILPIRNGLIYLREVFRHSTRSWELECPRGFRPHGYTLLETVERELAEEIGLETETVKELGAINSNTGLLAGKAQAFWVNLKSGEPNPHPEDGEAFGAIVKLSPKDVFEKIRRGEIRDGFTLSALQMAQAHGLLSIS